MDKMVQNNGKEFTDIKNVYINDMHQAIIKLT